jgi:hypothetical protein
MAPLHDGFVAAIALAEHAPNAVPFVVAIDHSETTESLATNVFEWGHSNLSWPQAADVSAIMRRARCACRSSILSRIGRKHHQGVGNNTHCRFGIAI